MLVLAAPVVFVIGGGNLKGYIRRTQRHPMLVGVILWWGTHLLTNGGLRETLLFDAFLFFFIYAPCSLLLTDKRATFELARKFVAIGIMQGTNSNSAWRCPDSRSTASISRVVHGHVTSRVTHIELAWATDLLI